jgi:hypothetical protein
MNTHITRKIYGKMRQRAALMNYKQIINASKEKPTKVSEKDVSKSKSLL